MSQVLREFRFLIPVVQVVQQIFFWRPVHTEKENPPKKSYSLATKPIGYPYSDEKRRVSYKLIQG